MNAFDDFVTNLLSVAETPAVVSFGIVQSFQLNGADPPTVTVRWKGVDVVAKCPRHYTPVVGHLVGMLRVGPQLAIFGAY